MAPRTNREPGMPPERKGGTNGSRKWSEYRQSRIVAHVDWRAMEGVLLLSLISSILDAGDAVLIGASRDGGTVVVTLISGDERQKWYARDNDELSAHFVEIMGGYEE